MAQEERLAVQEEMMKRMGLAQNYQDQPPTTYEELKKSIEDSVVKNKVWFEEMLVAHDEMMKRRML